MIIPTTYSDWITVLERFGDGDENVFEELNAGSFVLDSGTAQRFYLRVEEVYKKRKQNWLDKFQRSFQIQNIRTDDEFAIALRNAKQNLIPLSKFVSSKGLPEDLRKTLKKDLDDFVREIKKSLKENFSKTNNNNDKMLIMISTFSLPDIIQLQDIDKITDNKKENINISSIGRKIIF
ncbi:hypothetical protein [Chishuiella changwenlii]|uniref:hypothetical protein n=1 Tax=Chishuiella changwenlii TaxID=1434701 RepID=UPI002FDAE0D7